MIVTYSELYGRSKGNNTFSSPPDEMRAFLGELLVSDYSPEPRRFLHWTLADDVHNEVIASAFTRNTYWCSDRNERRSSFQFISMMASQHSERPIRTLPPFLFSLPKADPKTIPMLVCLKTDRSEGGTSAPSSSFFLAISGVIL